MPDQNFEARLRTLLHDALDTQRGPHPYWTDAPAARRISAQRRGRWPLRLLALAAVIAIGGGALTFVGSMQPQLDKTPTPAEPSPPAITNAALIPPVLRGQFMTQLGSLPDGSQGYPFYFLDLEDEVLIHGPSTTDDFATTSEMDGTDATWAGRIAEFTPVDSGVATVVIEAAPPCGEGTYSARYNEVEQAGVAEAWGLTFAQPRDSCADRVTILTSRTWNHQPTRLVPGQEYSSFSFTEPFHFLVPPVSPGDEWSPPVGLWTWLAPERLRFSNIWWRGELYDDEKLPVDLCDPGLGTLPDIPASPQSFESWLALNHLSIDQAIEVEIDGRTATRYDTSTSTCPDQTLNRFFGRWYLIPTPDDTILFNIYGDTQTELQLAERILASMRFD